MIKTRNCLEHHNGIVGGRDVDGDTGILTLSLPRMEVFFIHDGVETEQRFEKDTEILVKRLTTDKISFTIDEFKVIAFACWCFAQDLVSKLPQLPAAKPIA